MTIYSTFYLFYIVLFLLSYCIVKTLYVCLFIYYQNGSELLETLVIPGTPQKTASYSILYHMWGLSGGIIHDIELTKGYSNEKGGGGIKSQLLSVVVFRSV